MNVQSTPKDQQVKVDIAVQHSPRQTGVHADDLSEGGRDARTSMLEAAAACFVEEGFHGASMSRIAKRAGVSPGHIYHYFSGKDAMIAEIVRAEEPQLDNFVAEMEGMAAATLRRHLMTKVAEGVEAKTNLLTSFLTLEVLAEASRNEEIRDIVRASDRRFREGFARHLRDTLGLPGAEGRVEILMTLFSGLAMRIVRNPDLDRESARYWIEDTVRRVLEAPDPADVRA